MDRPSSSPTSRSYQAEAIREPLPGEDPVWDRASKLPGYDVSRWQQVALALVGAGTASHVGYAAIRKGVGRLGIYDGDVVELSNLPRQFFGPNQVFQNKALALGDNLRTAALATCTIDSYGVMVQAAVEQGDPLAYTHAVCLVDNDDTRAFMARECYGRSIPVVFAAFNGQAEGGYCFIQQSRPETPCFGCLFPHAVRHPAGARCGLGSSIDIVLVTAGLVAWALDALLGNRPLTWLYREISLAGCDANDGTRPVPVRPDCPICGSES